MEARTTRRSNVQLRLRWIYVLDPDLKKGQWSSKEDAALKAARAKLGDVKWTEIATLVPGRNDKQCRERCLTLKL